MPTAILKKRLAILLVVVAALWLVAALVGGDSGFLALRRTRLKLDDLEQKVGKLERENNRLREEIRVLQTQPEEIEKRARQGLMMARPNEDVILLNNRTRD